MIFLRCLVVGFGGLDFVVKTAKMYPLAINVYQGPPLAFAYPFSRGNSFVWGGRGDVVFAFVGHILCMGCLSEIVLSIVGGILILVVDDAAVRDLDDLPVHREHPPLPGLALSDQSLDVEPVAVPEREPFVVLESVVVFGIDFGVPRLGEPNTAVSIAVAPLSPAKYQREQEAFQAARKTECNVDFDSFRFRYRVLPQRAQRRKR